MRVSVRCKLLLPGLLFLALLGGCRAPALHVPPAAPSQPPPSQTHVPQLGTPYEIVPQASLLTILVYRGGALASAGHNHVIASHDLSGTIYVPEALLASSFEIHVPVATLTVDEAALRAQQPANEFPADVPESAKEGTRRNMLGEALLDAQHSPEIVLRSLQLTSAADSGTVQAQVQSSVRGQLRSFTVPVRYRRAADRTLEASGEFPLRQSELGLTPFSAMLGALQVQDEMHISFRIVAHAAALKTAPSGSL